MRDPATEGWDPNIYPGKIRAEIEDYEVLQANVLDAARGRTATSILDLGTGEGETARRVLSLYPDARLHGIDSSTAMLAGARERLPMERVTLTEQDLRADLPEGPFDLVVSALAVHHLVGEEKAELFARIMKVLSPGGRFVLGDLVIPDDPKDAVIELTEGYDNPSRVDEQLDWLEGAGLRPGLFWQRRDLAVLTADKN